MPAQHQRFRRVPQRFMPAQGDRVISKATPGSFVGTDLQQAALAGVADVFAEIKTTDQVLALPVH